MHLGDLKKNATKLAEIYYHDIEWYAPYHGESGSFVRGQCIYCRRHIQTGFNSYNNESFKSFTNGSALNHNCSLIDIKLIRK